VEPYTSTLDKVRALHAYFGITSLDKVMELGRYQAAFRIAAVGEHSPEAIAAWLRLGERKAQKNNCPAFDKERLVVALKVIRAMTLQKPEQFWQPLHALLAECGVVLIVCPPFPKSAVHGATFWIGREKSVLMVTNRCKWADVFWFSLFHEIGHILRHDRREVILEDGDNSAREKEANSFAADTLIPPDAYRKFIKQGRFYKEDVRGFADSLQIHPGIVVGRLQHDKRLKKNWLNALREKYE
jgi:HTH-type transcriptional regulator/antitoxin HigA